MLVFLVFIFLYMGVLEAFNLCFHGRFEDAVTFSFQISCPIDFFTKRSYRSEGLAFAQGPHKSGLCVISVFFA